MLAARGAATINVPDLPDEPVLLSYLVAASVIIEVPERQSLLASPTRCAADRRAGAARPGDRHAQELGTTPAPDLRSSPYNPN